jgi:hypothetical protein
MLLYQCDADYDEDFSFLQPLDLITKDVHELKKMINERRRKLQKGKNKESEKEHEGDRGRVREKERHEKEKESEKDKDKVENHKEQELHNENQISRDMVSDQEDKVNGAKKEDKVNGAKKEDKVNVVKKEDKVNSAKKEDKVNVKLDENEAFGGNHLFNGFGLHYLLSKCSMLHVWHFTLHSCIISIVLPICQCHTILYSFVSFNHFMFMHSFFFAKTPYEIYKIHYLLACGD